MKEFNEPAWAFNHPEQHKPWAVDRPSTREETDNGGQVGRAVRGFPVVIRATRPPGSYHIF